LRSLKPLSPVVTGPLPRPFVGRLGGVAGDFSRLVTIWMELEHDTPNRKLAHGIKWT